MKKSEKNIASGLSIGLCIGVAYGIIFDNLPLGIGIGLCFGVIETKKRFLIVRLKNTYFELIQDILKELKIRRF